MVHLDSAADTLLRLIFFCGFVTWIDGENQCRFSFIAQMLSVWEGPVAKEMASAQPGAAHSSGGMRSAGCDQFVLVIRPKTHTTVLWESHGERKESDNLLPGF